MEAPIPSWCILCSLVLTTNCMSIFIQSFKCSFKSCGCSISLEARINILSALVFLSLAGWRLFLDGRSVFFWLSELSFWSAEMRLCWLNCFCTLASRVFFYVLSLSLSFFVSVSVSVFYINALSAWTLTSNWRAINTFNKTWFLEFGNLAQLSNHVIITTTLMVWQH